MTINAFSTLVDLGDALDRGDCTAAEIASLYLRRIATGEQLHAFVDVDEQAAMLQAQASDLRRRSGHGLGPLDGLPVALKDLCEIAGQVATNGSATRRDVRSRVTATAVARLRAAGMVILGRTHMVEFAFGGWGTNPFLGAPRNPWDLAVHRAPGGSSSGSGVAVAAGLVPAAIGSDTGGSIRNPAALCGITGLKTTVGLIPLDGVLPLSQTFDSLGPMTRTAVDAALVAGAMAAVDYSDACTATADLRGRRIAVMREEDFPIAVEPGVADVFRDAQRVLADRGALLDTVPFPLDLAEVVRRNAQMIGAECYNNHRAEADDESLPIGPAVRQRLRTARAITAVDYLDAVKHQRAAAATWARFMGDFDAFLTPTMPFATCPIDTVDETIITTATFTRAANHLAGCAIALPAGFSPGGLPLGIQLMGGPFAEPALIRIGRAFQEATDWHRRTPDLSPLFG